MTPRAIDPVIYPNVNSRLFKGAIKISTILPWNLDWPMLEAPFANEFCSIVIIINPGAIKLGRSIPFIEFTDLPKANEKTAKKRRELIAGPITVWIPTFKNRDTSFLKRVKKHR